MEGRLHRDVGNSVRRKKWNFGGGLSSASAALSRRERRAKRSRIFGGTVSEGSDRLRDFEICLFRFVSCLLCSILCLFCFALCLFCFIDEQTSFHLQLMICFNYDLKDFFSLLVLHARIVSFDKLPQPKVT